MHEPVSLKPGDKMSVASILYDEYSRVLIGEMEQAETKIEKQRIKKRLRALELLNELYAPLGLILTHRDKSRFLSRIQSFFLEAENEVGNIFMDYRFLKLHCDLLVFLLGYATNASETLPHITTALQDLLQKVDAGITKLSELQERAA